MEISNLVRIPLKNCLSVNQRNQNYYYLIRQKSRNPEIRCNSYDIKKKKKDRIVETLCRATRNLVQLTGVNYWKIYDAVSGSPLPINHSEICDPFAIEFWLIEFIALENLCKKFGCNVPLNCYCNFHNIDHFIRLGTSLKGKNDVLFVEIIVIKESSIPYVYALTRT